ncbi:hypothetical protein [Dactylosporangium sp. NPDC005555]|uniref:effector-associated domain 2-containing protein n=1 Tax=Dactylosporangium sp. NPDC005555 TaxID=3154889 RepID=UPI0033BACFA9
MLRPERVTAVLVGVERYDAGTGWALPGPAADAVRFARWLRSQGVPPDRMHVLATALPDSERHLDELGLPVRTPDQGTVRDLLTRTLPALESELLFVYWGGHGIVDAQRTRRLFYADATEADKRNLDLVALLDLLSSDRYSGHPRQLLVIDACQRLVDELRLVARLPAERFSAGHETVVLEQQVLLAASTGQGAANLTARGTGVFSAAVLDELRSGIGQDGATLAEALDGAALAKALDERFRRRRAGGATTQVPAYLSLSGPGMEGQLVTATGGSPGRLELRQIGAIADAMLLNDELVDARNRWAIMLLMPGDIRAAVPAADRARTHVINWITTCARYPDGRAALVGALELGMADRAGLARTSAVIEREWIA